MAVHSIMTSLLVSRTRSKSHWNLELKGSQRQLECVGDGGSTPAFARRELQLMYFESKIIIITRRTDSSRKALEDDDGSLTVSR